MIDIVALGELLIDFAAKSTDAAGYPTMAANPGGAPGNFLAALNAYGRKTAFLGKVGNDAFGHLLLGTLNRAGIETKGIRVDDDVFEILGSGESDGQIENAMPVMEQLLEQYPDADVLMALNDPSAFGGLAAIQGAGLSNRFLVYSVDGSPEGKAMVSSGFLTATCAQFPSRVAEEAVKQAYAAINGGCECKEVIVTVELLTKCGTIWVRWVAVMKTERKLINIASVMFALNFSILAFYSLICMTTTFRICDTLLAHDFFVNWITNRSFFSIRIL